jgi:hypothetical protein
MLHEILFNLVQPIVIGVLAFMATSTLTTWRDRKRQSFLGAAVCATLIEELNNGIKLMEAITNNQSPNGLLPRKSWNGMGTVSDEVLERLLCLSEGNANQGFPIGEIRIHLKNYFDHICCNADAFIQKSASGITLAQQEKDSLVSGCLQPARGVLAMVEEAQHRLRANVKRWFPK